MILCEDLRGQREALRVAERARAAIAEPFALRGREVTLQASVGITRARRSQTHAQDLLREADVAMYQAKRRGGGIELYETTHELEFESRLRDAVSLTRLELHYQPVLALAGRRRRALDRGAGSLGASRARAASRPADFLPLAEEIGVIARDRSVGARPGLRSARALARRGPRRRSGAGLGEPVLRVAALAGPRRRARAGTRRCRTPARMPFARADRGEPRARSDARRGPSSTILARLGVRLCLDDYGTDRSTIGALVEPSVRRREVRRAAGEPDACDRARRAHGAAGVETVAKGVETEAQLEAVRDLGCDAAQGFLFAAPAPAEEVGRWLASRTG